MLHASCKHLLTDCAKMMLIWTWEFTLGLQARVPAVGNLGLQIFGTSIGPPYRGLRV